jgi:YkoY family integral membrane protein
MLPRHMDWLITALDLHTFVPADLLVVLVLVVLEGLLSCDNAVVLALLVRNLPPEQRGKALRYGIIGAYVFRIAALFLAVWIMTIWWIKVAGGVYLCWLAIDFFRKHGQGGKDKNREVKLIFGLGAFWSTVFWVEATDIVFSIDSIAAAVALSKKLWVLILGGLLGILAMRFAAQAFVKLLEKFPRLEACAFAAVAVIGLKLLLEFPVDVLGRTHPLPPDAGYTTSQEYRDLVAKHVPPAVSIPHVLNMNLEAPPAPEAARMAKGAEAAVALEAPALQGADRAMWIDKRARNELADAEASWALHHRPFLEIEGWASSLVVLAIFLSGFRRPRERRL